MSLERGSREDAESIATALRDMGFEVGRVGRFGLSFSGDESLVEQVFDVHLRAKPGSLVFHTPKGAPEAWSRCGASVYLPQAPEFFP